MHHSIAGIGNQRHAGVRNQRHTGARLDLGHQIFRSHGFVVLVVTHQRPGDAVVVQQLARMARILTGDQIGFAQRAHSPVRDVLQVANGCGNQVQRAAHVLSSIR